MELRSSLGSALVDSEDHRGSSLHPSQQAAAVIKSYVYFFSLACLLAAGIASFKLPKMESAGHQIGQKVNDSLWNHPNLIFGAAAIFVYVGGEVAIGSSISNYLALDNIGLGFITSSTIPDSAMRYREARGKPPRNISPSIGEAQWSGALSGLRCCRKIKTGTLLAFCAIMAGLLVTISVLTNGHIAMWSILSVGLFNSIMFPCIFTLGDC